MTSARLVTPAAAPAEAPRWLQRKCACGGSAGLAGQCADCERKKMLGVQTRLTTGTADDPLEREADAVASRVLAQAPAARRFSVVPTHPAPDSVALRRLPAAPTPVGHTAPASVHRTLARPGRPLEPALREDMEQRFGVDFSQVRVHADADAARSARDVSAQAYAAGRHLVFGSGRFAPGTASGRHLLAHELAHVVQQAGPGAPALMRKGFESTVQVCRRVLVSRHFQVDNGGVRVVFAAQDADTNIPNCRRFNFGVSLARSEDWWPDKEIGTCEHETGGIRQSKFANLPRGTYYLTFWRLFDHPECCLEGDVMVFDEAQAGDGEGCQRAKDLSTMDIVHGALDLAGFVPVLGAIPDGINAGIYVFEGDWANAGLSAVAALPAVGDGIKLGTMAGKTVIKVEARTALKLGEEGLATELKGLKAASEAPALPKVEKGAADAAEAAKKPAAPAKDPPAASKDKAKDKKKKEEKTKKPKCTAAEIEAANLALHKFCNKPRSCTMQGDTCASATAKVAAGMGCVDGRVVLQQRCFRKGDPGYEKHMQQIAQASAALHNCEAVMKEKCL